jgi:hypothetical protein
MAVALGAVAGRADRGRMEALARAGTASPDPSTRPGPRLPRRSRPAVAAGRQERTLGEHAGRVAG